MDEAIVVYLCIAESERGIPEVKAIYDDESQAKAWVDGFQDAMYWLAGYMPVKSNEGSINIVSWWRNLEKTESEKC